MRNRRFAPCSTLAESVAGSSEAPPAVVLGLALDQSDIASAVLTRSPLLTDAQLIDCACVGDSVAQAAIALRHEVSPAVASALAEIASREAQIALAVNEGANLPEFAMRRMVERFGDDSELREALLGRPWLPSTVRAALASAAAQQLTRHAVQSNWLSPGRSERLAKDARERAAIIIAAGCAAFSQETGALAAYLRVSGQLTPGLALRALLCGQAGLFAAALVELTGLGPRRIAALIREPASSSFAAAYAEAGLPESLLVAFRAALEALSQSSGKQVEGGDDGGLRLPLIQFVLRRCEAARDPSLDRLIALLRRFEADAVREAARNSLARLRAAGDPKARAMPAAPEPEAQPALATGPGPAAPEGGVELTREAFAENAIVVDLVAMERELMAA